MADLVSGCEHCSDSNLCGRSGCKLRPAIVVVVVLANGGIGKKEHSDIGVLFKLTALKRFIFLVRSYSFLNLSFSFRG